MTIKSLTLTNFRSWSNYKLEFSDATILIGPNGVGKTNIIESIWLLSTGRSWRTSKDIQLVNWENDFCRVNAVINNEAMEKTELELFLQKKHGEMPQLKAAKINGVKHKLLDIIGQLNAVLFSPEEIALLDGAPQSRRRFLDIMLSQTNHTYALNLAEYQKVIKERNKLLYYLKIGRAKPDELDFWDGKLISLGKLIVAGRDSALKFFNKALDGVYSELAGVESHLTLKYKPAAEESRLADLVYANRARDIESVATNIGPHRDDFAVFLNNIDITSFGSRGEYRSAVLAIKLAELKFLEEKTGEKPILLLDDIFSELDAERRAHLAKIVEGQQTIITTTDLDHIEKGLQKKAKIVKVEKS